jgi:hypothetical protein
VVLRFHKRSMLRAEVEVLMSVSYEFAKTEVVKNNEGRA